MFWWLKINFDWPNEYMQNYSRTICRISLSVGCQQEWPGLGWVWPNVGDSTRWTLYGPSVTDQLRSERIAAMKTQVIPSLEGFNSAVDCSCTKRDEPRSFLGYRTLL